MRRRYGCWCKATAIALRRQQKRNRAGILLPPRASSWNGVASARRLQAAAVLGYSSYALAPMLGVAPARVRHLQSRRFATVTDQTAERVRVLVERLHRQPAPIGAGVTRARREARNHGWAPLNAWEPEEIGDPDALSDLEYQRTPASTPSTGAEHLERLDLGFTLEDIAADRGISIDSVKVAINREHRRRQTDQIRKISRVTVSQLEHARDRIAQGSSYGMVAAELGISRPNLSNLLAGRVSPAPDGLATSGPGRTTSNTPTAPPQEGRVA